MTASAPQPERPRAWWRATIVVPAQAVAAFEAALERGAAAMLLFEAPPGPWWRVEALLREEPVREALAERLAAVAAEQRVAPPPLEVAPVAEADWVALSRQDQSPIRAGRYHTRPSHAPPPPPGALALIVDSGPAFGTGLHESTRGCLLALDLLARARRVRRPLDLGCGSGILAMAMALTWRVPTMAVDVDPIAVTTARANARLNGLGPLVRVLESDGLRHRRVAGGGPYDLIVANILEEPLIRLAPAVGRAAARDAVAVLSGLLAWQERPVLAAYRGQGFPLCRAIRLGEWSTLVLGRRPRKRG